ncbi:MAG: sugar-binding protein [Victivallaceae bacterium]|nr:sugar-binding protein [Victivallaceae bacterium]
MTATVWLGCQFDILAGENLVRNPGFEENAKKAVGWQTMGKWFEKPKGSGISETAVDTTVAHEGKNSLVIKGNQNRGYALQDVPVKKGVSYVITGWVKASDLDINGAVSIEQMTKLPNGKMSHYNLQGKKIPGGVCICPVSSTQDWEKFTVEVKASGETDVLKIVLLTKAANTGTVWFDDIRMEEKSETGLDSANDSGELISAELFPAEYQKGIYHANKNFPAVMVLKFTKSVTADKLKNPRIVIDMPAGYSCLGVCPKFAKRDSNGIFQWKMEKMDTSGIERNGLKYTRYIVYLNDYLVKELLKTSIQYGVEERIYIQSSSNIGVNDKQDAFIKLASDNWEGKEKKFKLILLPELPFNKIKTDKFGMVISHTMLSSMTVPDVKISKAYTDFWRSLTAKPYILFPPRIWKGLKPELKATYKNNFQILLIQFSAPGGTPAGCGNLKKWIEYAKDKGKIPPEYIVVAPGKKISFRLLCPGYLGKNDFFWNDYFASSLKQYLPDPLVRGILYDIEPGAMDFCFCRNCLKDFKNFAKLEKIPSVEEIQKKYPDKWFDFRVRQNSAMIKAFCDCIRKNFPGVMAVVCTDPLHSSGSPVSKWCGVDARLSDRDADLFMNMPYYSGIRYFDDIKLNNEVLKTPNFPFNNPAQRIRSCFSCYTPEKIKQNIIATAALGGKGFGFWPDDVLDGKYLQNIQAAYTLAAKAEDYYSAKRNDRAILIKPASRNIIFKSLRGTVHEKDGNFLATIINYAPSELTINLKAAVPEKQNYRVRDVETGGLFYKDKATVLATDDIRTGFMVNVPGNGIKVIEITKHNIEGSSGKTPAVYQNEIKKKLENTRKNYPNNYNSPGTAEISWSTLDQKVSLPLMKMAVQNTENPPLTDGILNDDCWKNTAPAGFIGESGETVKDKTDAYLAWDEKNLYLAFVNHEPNGDKLKAASTKRDEPNMWKDDSVEIFIAPYPEKKKSYYQFIINTKGIITDSHWSSPWFGNNAYTSNIEAGVKVEKDRWILEVKIPFRDLSINDPQEKTFTANFYRNRYAGTDPVYSCWSPTFAHNHHLPERFGVLLLKKKK